MGNKVDEISNPRAVGVGCDPINFVIARESIIIGVSASVIVSRSRLVNVGRHSLVGSVCHNLGRQGLGHILGIIIPDHRIAGNNDARDDNVIGDHDSAVNLGSATVEPVVVPEFVDQELVNIGSVLIVDFVVSIVDLV